MKKYVKPELFYERYELSQHIADCQWEMKNSMDKDACAAHPDPNALPVEWGTLFTATASCEVQNWENYCYQPGAEGDIKVFVS